MRVISLLLALAFGMPAIAAPGATNSTVATAKKKKKKRKKRKKRAGAKKKRGKKKSKKEPIEVAINIGVGPAFHMLTGPIQDDQRFHFGLKLDLRAVADQATIRKNLHRVPKKYRGYAKGLKEFSMGHPLIPDTLFISPRVNNTAMYGANWRPFAIGIPFTRAPKLAVGLGINLTYTYINTTIDKQGTPRVDTTTHFLRPGADLSARIEIPFSKTFLVDLGWTSMFYPPQEIGGDIFALGELEESIWHIGQMYMRFHFRVPYTTTL